MAGSPFSSPRFMERVLAADDSSSNRTTTPVGPLVAVPPYPPSFPRWWGAAATWAAGAPAPCPASCIPLPCAASVAKIPRSSSARRVRSYPRRQGRAASQVTPSSPASSSWAGVASGITGTSIPCGPARWSSAGGRASGGASGAGGTISGSGGRSGGVSVPPPTTVARVR
jgi:hypothetical protein